MIRSVSSAKNPEADVVSLRSWFPQFPPKRSSAAASQGSNQLKEVCRFIVGSASKDRRLTK